MKDYSQGVPVTMTEYRKTGERKVRCPECKISILRWTSYGTMAALQAHLDEQHFIPIKGNA